MANVPWIKLWGRDCIDDATSRTAQLSNEHFGMWVKLLWGLARCPQAGQGYLTSTQPVPDSVWRGLLGAHHHTYSRFLAVVIDELHLFYRDSNGAICVEGDITKTVPAPDVTNAARQQRHRDRNAVTGPLRNGGVTPPQPEPEPEPEPKKRTPLPPAVCPPLNGRLLQLVESHWIPVPSALSESLRLWRTPGTDGKPMYPDGWLERAVESMIENGKTMVPYLSAILKGYVQEGGPPKPTARANARPAKPDIREQLRILREEEEADGLQAGL